MARMHSRARGKSRSTRPSKKVAPSWLKYKPKEVELLVIKYAKEGKNPSQIGIYLRDGYGIPDVKLVTNKSITQILKEKNLLKEIPEDLMALIRKAVLIRKHLGENKKDMPAKRGLQLTESKIKRLTKYYKKIGRLPMTWRYDPERIKLVVE
ncbi:30S ribosomal protein S15 [Euryarchaeota archaeon SM23-78]|nr:MAG: 30S ribosomal protein S15 [Euryarchaeota archaeon SM23-78]MBW3000704.1 30S ribosomal protein S15 [Candidatus Woesearchaeota archaeon]